MEKGQKVAGDYHLPVSVKIVADLDKFHTDVPITHEYS
jgi:hypothetical protein